MIIFVVVVVVVVVGVFVVRVCASVVGCQGRRDAIVRFAQSCS